VTALLGPALERGRHLRHLAWCVRIAEVQPLRLPLPGYELRDRARRYAKVGGNVLVALASLDPL
jgi:hypothetical protein